MRIFLRGDLSSGEFATKPLEVGDGQVPEINGEILLSIGSNCKYIDEIEEKVFQNNVENYISHQWLSELAMLAPKMLQLQKIFIRENISFTQCEFYIEYWKRRHRIFTK